MWILHVNYVGRAVNLLSIAFSIAGNPNRSGNYPQSDGMDFKFIQDPLNIGGKLTVEQNLEEICRRVTNSQLTYFGRFGRPEMPGFSKRSQDQKSRLSRELNRNGWNSMVC